MTEHVILTAITVDIDGDFETAQRALMDRLVPLLQSNDPSSPIIEWWIAEDERYDGSDCDSAVFIPSRIAGPEPIVSQREALSTLQTRIELERARKGI